MPWEIRIVASKNQPIPLGQRDDVVARVAKALPGAVLERQPSPPPELLAEMPEIVRENFASRRILNADYEADGFSLQLYADDSPVLDSIGIEVRGNGNPLAALAELCLPNGWLAINVADGTEINLSAVSSPEWERFRAWRDRTIRRF